jgi:hypothetical protein
MATESSDPRVGLIVRIGILSIGTLFAVHAGLTAYFDRMVRDETYRKVGSVAPDALMSLRADEQQRLTTGSMPIDKSMQTLAAKGRMGAGPAITPTESKDIAPLQGWTQMPGSVPPGMMASAAPATSEAPSAPAVPSASPSASGRPAPTGSSAPRHP